MISLHLIADNADPVRLDRAVTYLKNTKQPYVNIAGGSQIDRAMQLVERVQIEVPCIQVFWRVLQDTGNIFSMSANQWWSDRVTPRLKWMQDHKVIMVVDNESSGDDNIIKNYVAQSIIRMNMLHSAGLGGAFCRFATGNIGESQYILLKPLLDLLGAQDWVSPNEYSNKPGKSSAGHLERYKLIQAVVPNKKLNISIGECGILDDYKANAGYLGIPMSGYDMAAQLIADEIWYNVGTIPRFLFAIGGYSDWASLQVNDDALTFLEDYYAKNPIGAITVTTPSTPPPAPYTPEPITVGMSYKITTPEDYVNIHVNPDVTSAVVGKLPNGSTVTVTDEAAVAGDYLRHIQFGALTGWIAMQKGKILLQLISVTDDPPPIAPSVPVALSVLQNVRDSLQTQVDVVDQIIKSRSEE